MNAFRRRKAKDQTIVCGITILFAEYPTLFAEFGNLFAESTKIKKPLRQSEEVT